MAGATGRATASRTRAAQEPTEPRRETTLPAVSQGMLSPYRVLDLTDESGFLCGRLLADLGADVIKVEPPGGDPARHIGPFYGDDPAPEKSLYWFAFNANKRGVTLDLESPAGHDQFAALVATADFVVESFAPGRMVALGFGYEAIRRINPACILVSISPFGQTGPYRDYKAPDIVAWALGGHMSICGPPEGPPYHVSHHSQSHLLGASDAAVGAMIALQARQRSGRGQHVDVAIRDAVVDSTYQVTANWDMIRTNRALGQRAASINFPWTWPCQDGSVVAVLSTGARGNVRMSPFVDWMASEGFHSTIVSRIDWDTLTPDTITTEIFDAVITLFSRFFRSRTKLDLYEQGIVRGRSVIPVQTAADLAASAQLHARAFWEVLHHDDLGADLTYPGPWAKGTECPPDLRRRAPRIGEHNEEILPALTAPGLPPPAADPSPPAPLRPDPKPLAGLKILDFGWFMVGPVTTRVLADYGATVVKIESSRRPDMQRLVGPHKDGISASTAAATTPSTAPASWASRSTSPPTRASRSRGASCLGGHRLRQLRRRRHGAHGLRLRRPPRDQSGRDHAQLQRPGAVWPSCVGQRRRCALRRPLRP